jgi:hypothetical protein
LSAAKAASMKPIDIIATALAARDIEIFERIAVEHDR